MSLIAPSNKRGGGKGGAQRKETNKIYANPLPLLFITPQTSHYSPYHVLGLFGLSNSRVENPHCEGSFDPVTRSVWVEDRKDAMILWRRGFFGKGDLSRSEPSWYTRQVNARKAAGKHLTAEEVRERRRAERKQFKLDRARALAQAAAEAEAAFEEGRQAPVIAIPSGATWKPQSQAPTAEVTASEVTPEDETDIQEEQPLEDVEHLQLTLPEAFFLIWTMDCLTVLDHATSESMDLKKIWTTFRAAYHPPGIPSSLSSSYLDRFDNPFLVHYAAYHYYRSHGWVVKGGIKFCVDYLLYKRGPVFQHAEFAVVILPTYEDPKDEEDSPFNLNASPYSWTWLSTINRVNTQVQKTLILTYVTIPAKSRVSTDMLSSPASLAQYSVRDVVLRRFVPARMRD
ncbi:hypothetical protein NM688_g5044 [Phlebia brevispora]|uniref:Uncharacterized protein n=1 Tax=Phlebia brevispora TaxID=194682 RepID=A0ACC1T0Y5_9APHY|nr:hypothetical protein NM688_g5044 [Phlebia brevispora]